MRWAGTTIAGAAKIVDRLLQAGRGSGPADTFRKLRPIGRNIVHCPVMPNPGWSVRVLAEQDQAPRLRRHIGPLQWYGQILAVAREAARDALRIREGRRTEVHALPR